jgi:hypothetical protein
MERLCRGLLVQGASAALLNRDLAGIARIG